MSRIEPPRVETKPMRFLTHAEVARLADSIDQRYGSVVLLAAYGGLRAGELFALRWENVDLDHLCVRVVEQVQHVSGHLLVSAPKTDAGRRQVPIPAFVAAELAARRTDEDRDASAGLVFAAPGGGYLRDSNFRRRAWVPAVKRAGLAPLRLHDLRHTCASLAIAAGADIKGAATDARPLVGGTHPRPLRPPHARAGRGSRRPIGSARSRRPRIGGDLGDRRG